MRTYKILYAEDDETLAFLTTDHLEQQGFQITHCGDGESCLEVFQHSTFDLCILDIMMPKKDGFEVATAIRRQNLEIPIIFLSAKTLKEDKLKGLRIGADDYLVKPFSIEELILKMGVFLRRSEKTNRKDPAPYQIGKYHFDVENYTLYNGNEKINLTQRESELLKLFLDNKNMVLKREQILTSLWGNDDYFMGRSLDVFISRLRKILSTEPHIAIENLHGIGFKFSVKS